MKASHCTSCSGKGTRLSFHEVIDCPACYGIGWVPPSVAEFRRRRVAAVRATRGEVDAEREMRRPTSHPIDASGFAIIDIMDDQFAA